MSRCSLRSFLPAVLSVFASFAAENISAQELTQEKAAEALRRVVAFYRTKVGYEGAYLWRYSAALDAQEGEGVATRTSGWTQPPGAPSVGEAYLLAWRLSGETRCREAAVEVAHALVRAQLVSGGWSSHFELGEPGRKRYAYRVDARREQRARNHSTFDDNKSQSALRLLMRVDEALEFRDAKIHEAVEYALEHMLAVQYPNGAWPQQFTEPPVAEEHPVLQANYPKDWPRTHPKQDYREYYTLNDNNMSHIIDMLMEAKRIYGREDCHQAAVRTGEFYLRAQLPEPQPGWAQQYNRQMEPAWARKFEPPAITGGESQSVMRDLLKLYRYTGDKRFLAPLPRALSYYEKSQLDDGRLARFYELQSNRPLYFTKDYRLTYDDGDVPTHYAFKVGSRLSSIRKSYKQLVELPTDRLMPAHEHARPASLSPRVTARARQAIRQLDERGAWVEAGSLRSAPEVEQVIEMRTFAKNLESLARYVGAK